MIAAKLEEIKAPTVENWVFLSDNSFTVEALVAMEDVVLQALDFRISVHTSHFFAHRLALAASMTDKEQSYATMLLELSLHDFSLSAYERMSKLAAAACHLSLQTLRPTDAPLWTKAMEFFSGGYRDSDPSFRALVQVSHQSSVIRHQSSVISHQPSVIRHPSSVVCHPSSIIRIEMEQTDWQ